MQGSPTGPEAEGTEPQTSLYQRVGGIEYFKALVERFYTYVAADAVLRPMYPENLEPGKTNLALFLVQLWGGPPYYSRDRGHPRLRMRHMPFAIGQAERDAWYQHMREAVLASDVSEDDAAMLLDYFDKAATFMINRD